MKKNNELRELLWIPLDLLAVGKLELLMKSLTFKKKYHDESVELFQVDTDRGVIGIPVHHFRSFTNYVDKREVGKDIDFQFTSHYRQGQEDVVNKFIDLYDRGKTGFIIEAVPGWGKTCVCIKLISIVNKTTLVIVPRSNLVKQWVSRLIEHSSLKRSEIGIAMDGKVDYRGKKVVVGLVHTVSMDRFGDIFKNYFGMIVYDEVDRSVPPQTFCTVASMFPARVRLGVSATLERNDGLDVVFQKHIGQTSIKADDSGGTLKPKVIIHEFTKTSGDVPYYLGKLQRRGVLLSRLSENMERSKMIARYAKLIYKSKRQCLVISDRVRQLQYLKAILVDAGIPSKEIGFYVRQLYVDGSGAKKSVKDSERQRVAKECRIVLATYGMMSLGTDIVSLAGLVMATPQSEVKQTIGRIVREMKGKKQPVIVDVVDKSYSDAVDWAYSRKRYYKSEDLALKFIES